MAAPGTGPGLLARLVARTLQRGAGALLRQAREEARAGEDPTATLERLAGEPGATAMAAATDVARRWRGCGVVVACAGDPHYPDRLLRGWPGTGGPLWLAGRGCPGLTRGRPTVAIVGSRRASGYGTGVAAWLAESATRAGAVVVSGGARGVDAAAHRAALCEGPTVVVLGCGHEIRYPAAHAAPDGLFDRIVAGGGTLLSELLPHARPHPGHVRARNRIVAGLADAVVVVEGGGRSGSLLTASEALERAVPVLAVPGDVRAPGSVAPHRLLAEGAAPCRDPDDLLAVLGPGLVGAAASAPGPSPGDASGAGGPAVASTLPTSVREELARRWPRPVQVDELARVTGVPAGRLLAALTRARIAGETAESPDGVRLTRQPPSPGS